MSELMKMLTTSGVELIAVEAGSQAAGAVGQHWNAVKHFLNAGETEVLAPFEGMRARAERAQHARRMRRLAGVIVAAIVVVVVAVVVSTSSSGGGKAPKAGSPASKADIAAVSRLLAGIPQSRETLGSPSAPPSPSTRTWSAPSATRSRCRATQRRRTGPLGPATSIS